VPSRSASTHTAQALEPCRRDLSRALSDLEHSCPDADAVFSKHILERERFLSRWEYGADVETFIVPKVANRTIVQRAVKWRVELGLFLDRT
jgi:hypothetical protein